MTVTRSDPGLAFWLRYVEHCGGLTEPTSEGALVMLPTALAERCALPEETAVTADPDVAREDGAMLFTTGHPVLLEAADNVLSAGDVGVVALTMPPAPAPDPAWLQDMLRDRVTVEHGRIEVTGLATRVDRPVLRLGALVTYTVSDEETYQERAECVLDAPTGRPLDRADVARLQQAPRAVAQVPRPAPALLAAAARSLPHAHRLIEDAATRRRDALSAQASAAHLRERRSARDYYADALRSLEKRRATAPPDRVALLAARIASTREERDRRMAEIDEKFRARHDVRPFRLHVLLVPGWRVPVDVCRGPRRYPFAFDWLPALGCFATERCPHCGGLSTFSASKTRLGCRACLPPAGATAS
jgi:hypothetical protein